jgi:hypothetical protein
MLARASEALPRSVMFWIVSHYRDVVPQFFSFCCFCCFILVLTSFELIVSFPSVFCSTGLIYLALFKSQLFFNFLKLLKFEFFIFK